MQEDSQTMASKYHALFGLWAVLMLAAIMQASAGRSMLQCMHMKPHLQI